LLTDRRLPDPRPGALPVNPATAYTSAMDGNGGSVRVSPGRAWIIGGALFLGSVVVGVGTQPLVALIAGGTIVATLLFSAALVVFAIGINGRGSVTARKPLGTVALCALAIWTPVVAIVQQLMAVTLITSGALLAYAYVTALVQFALALIAVVEIGRARAVPTPWTWVPAAVLAIMTVLWFIEHVPYLLADPAAALVLMTIEGLVRVAAPVLFGVVAIVYANRVPDIPAASRAAHPTRSRRVSS
jgi:hypothetical protein